MPASRSPVDPPVPRPEFWRTGPFDRARDRLQLLRSDPRVGVVLLVVIAVVAGFLWYRAGAGSADGAPPRAAVPVSQASSPTINSTLCPSTPPLALRSSTASSVPR